MKTTSQQQRDANKTNAQKSTGPRTPEGKDRSRRNALKHGLLAKSILINEKDPHEDPNDFNDLLNQLRDDLRPKGALEQLLTQRIAVSYWRLRRAYRFEAVSICEHRRDCTESLTAQLAQGISGITRDPADFVLPSAKDLEKLIRYESLIDRELNRTMLQLQRLQRTRKTTDPNSSPSCLRASVPSSLPPSLPQQPNEPKSTRPEAHGLQSVGPKRDQSPDPQRHNPDTKRTQTPPSPRSSPQASPPLPGSSPRQTNPNAPLPPLPRSGPAHRIAPRPSSDSASSPLSSCVYRSVQSTRPVLIRSIPVYRHGSELEVMCGLC